MSETQTHMAREVREIPQVVARQLAEGMPLYRHEGQRLALRDLRLLATCARGTSDHAAAYLKYLVETRLGIPVASIGPSVASIYGARLKLADAVCLTISQSGGSPDLVALQRHAREGGARTIALLNVTESPVGAAADCVLPVLAGPEQAVAATKTYVANLVALAALVAAWCDDAAILSALERLPEAFDKALACDWSAAAIPLANASSVFTLSRGPGLSLAFEGALKFKETCRLHVEAYSAAEVRHGPIALAGDRFAALVFMPRDRSRASVEEAVEAMRKTGARVFVVDDAPGKDVLPSMPAPHESLVPLVQAVSFYVFVERLARELGEDPDRPEHLRKVTQTV